MIPAGMLRDISDCQYQATSLLINYLNRGSTGSPGAVEDFPTAYPELV
jgi:hypothetical protein